MDWKIIQTNQLDTLCAAQLESLMAQCGSYEPFTDCGTPYFLAFAETDCTHLIGFLSFVINANGCHAEAEITALVAPDFRRQGVFRALLCAARKVIEPLIGKNGHLLGVFPKALLQSSLSMGIAYSEYLFLLTAPNAAANAAAPSVCFSYETYFSDNREDFLLYKGSDDEPCAVCSLDYGNTYTNIYGVYVDEGCRGQGIGTLLMKHLIQEYFLENTLPLLLNVRSTNTAAVKLYQNCGFQMESSVDFYYL